MKTKHHLLTRTVRQVLQSGARRPQGRCSLPRPLYGSARVQLLFHLDRHSLVRITNWGTDSAHGIVIGTITIEGVRALENGWYR